MRYEVGIAYNVSLVRAKAASLPGQPRMPKYHTNVICHTKLVECEAALNKMMVAKCLPAVYATIFLGKEP